MLRVQGEEIEMKADVNVQYVPDHYTGYEIPVVVIHGKKTDPRLAELAALIRRALFFTELEEAKK